MKKQNSIMRQGPSRFDFGFNFPWDDYDGTVCYTGVELQKKDDEAYDYLKTYSEVHNVYSANVAQPNPFTHKVMYIIDTLTKLGVKSSLDIFEYSSGYSNSLTSNKIFWGSGSYSSHKLVNIIAEPNPLVTGPAIVFIAHHDVCNVHSSNCQDNGASVCNLIRLAALVHKAQAQSKRVIILFSDSEEFGAKGAKQFANKCKRNKENSAIIEHETFGEIEAFINLELTGLGTVVWSDCSAKKIEIELHEKLEHTLGANILKLNTPPNDAIAFRHYGYPVLCIGTLPQDDIKDKHTWRLCHSLSDTIDKCDRANMETFTNFLFNLTKITTTEHGNNNGANQADESVRI